MKIRDLNLEFNKNKIYSIVGSSGSGKSTIINLLYRLWDIDYGSIKINGYNLEELDLKHIRKRISILTQDILILNTSIKDNICLGKKIPKERLIDICDKLGIFEFANYQEQELDTIIGEHGIKLSGGQKQRIALARAIAVNSDVLILDEATSALDNVSQSRILKDIEPYLENKIVIIIAHRLFTIKDVDKIYVMAKGRVVEEGTHNDLLCNSAVYRNLYYVE